MEGTTIAARLIRWPLLCVFALALACALIAFYWPFLCGAASFYLFDFTYVWEPFLNFMSRQLAAHHFPLWNPYANCGVPQIAFMARSAFYPGNWLFPAMRFSQAMAWNMTLNQLGAGLGMFLLVDSFGFGLWCALAAGSIYALSGMQFSLQTTYSLQAIMAWLPLSMWSLHRLATTRDAGRSVAVWFLLSCLFVYLLVSAGMAEIAVVCLIGLAIFSCVVSLRSHGLRTAAVRISFQLLAIVTGTLSCAPQLFPLLEWARISPRSVGLSLADILRWSTSWYDLSGFFLPQPLGDLFDVSNPYHPLVLKETQPYIASVFLGPTVMTAAAWGVADRKFSARWLVVAIALAAICLSLGSNWEVATAVVQLTGIKLFRYPIKLLPFAVIAICFCAARGLHPSNYRDRNIANRVVALLWIALLLASGLALLVSQGSFGASQAIVDFLSAPFLPGNNAAVVFAGAMALALCACSTAVVGLFTCLLCHLQVKGIISFKNFAAFVSVLAIGQLLVFAFVYQRHAGPANYFTQPLWLAESIRMQPPSGPQATPPRICTLYEEINGPRNLIDKNRITETDYEYNRQMLVPPSPMDANIGSTLYESLGETLEHDLVKRYAEQQHHLSNDLPLSIYCRSTSTKCVLTQARFVSQEALLTEPMPQLDARYFKLTGENLTWNLRIYTVKDMLPRTYFAPAVKWGAPHKAVVEHVRLCDQSKFDPGKITILEHNFAGEKGLPLNLSPADLQSSSAVLTRCEAAHLEVEATTPKANYLVLTDEFYPGWLAAVDGKPTAMYRANAYLKAVLVPAGKHTVSFSYKPQSLRWGLLTAAAMLVIQAFAAIWLWRKTPSRRQL